MAHFWVNQGATYQVERSAGLLWAPEFTSSGATLTHWESMAAVAPGDLIFNYADQALRGYAVATSHAVPMAKPYAVGAQYSPGQGGRAVFCNYTSLQTPVPFATLAAVPGLVAALQKGPNPVLDVNGRVALKYLCAIGPATAALLLPFVGGNPPGPQAPLTPTMIMQLRAARVGQGQFRTDLLMALGGCAVTGITNPSFLVASHIKPWSMSNNTERLDPNNGLLLAAGVDAAFDAGYIGFDSGWEMVSASTLHAREKTALGIPLGSFALPITARSPGRATFLAWHKANYNL